MPDTITYRKSSSSDEMSIAQFLAEHWGDRKIVSRGRIHDGAQLPALLAISDGAIVGLLTYAITNGECEIVSLDAPSRLGGVGSELLKLLAAEQSASNWRRVWLITTNDNLDALRFYQRRGFRLVAVHQNALEVSRRLKPSIPKVGNYGIPIRDEIELERI